MVLFILTVDEVGASDSVMLDVQAFHAVNHTPGLSVVLCAVNL
jgi:hypothetical protein